MQDSPACIICYSVENEKQETVQPMRDLLKNKYILPCQCNCLFHGDCLRLWLERRANKCPICQMRLTLKLPEEEHTETPILVDYHPVTVFFYACSCRVFYCTFSIFMLWNFVCTLLLFYDVILYMNC